MSDQKIDNISASVHQKLLNKARAEIRPFQELLQYYAMERFLYRLSVSKHKSKFILKGALALVAVRAPSTRPTRDIDFKGEMSNDIDDVVVVTQDICRARVVDDGLSFDADTIVGTVIDDDDEYSGVRITFRGFLGSAEVPMQLDIGFGDTVVPEPTEIEYPALLDFPNPKIRVYPFESTIAEKLEAMVHFGEVNSRMKDFYDIWFLSRNFDFEGRTLQRAIEATFITRSTDIPRNLRDLTARLESADKSPQWTAFIKRSNIVDCPTDFADALESIFVFLTPMIEHIAAGEEIRSSWLASVGWMRD